METLRGRSNAGIGLAFSVVVVLGLGCVNAEYMGGAAARYGGGGDYGGGFGYGLGIPFAPFINPFIGLELGPHHPKYKGNLAYYNGDYDGFIPTTPK